MSLRPELAAILARDTRYALPAYQFVMEALDDLERQRRRKRIQARRSPTGRVKPIAPELASPHVSGAMLCEAVRDLANRQFGVMARTVLNHWGVYTTSDLGEIVYNLIASGNLKKSERDRREDFDNVFDFDEVFGIIELPAAVES
ncbi:hypothetical protein Isop_2263 [Isosphaera pallida ATCC 43644]|jgi:uncharacterized repeat protein (TIGR04138 family)|uniref:Uncharacterized protein n=1 Tax=Isosphaera pallida (strain ATCC 43644 / DSM 9630 / IS1B) TaxID=575540 RepID=E8R5T4_ISOPI|nr:Minf_1886 family protein [Isosphaera pallida]ADV62841.1 hypothetical protein Isop_2263 [Isosphaera pallida ATCC 43644]